MPRINRKEDRKITSSANKKGNRKEGLGDPEELDGWECISPPTNTNKYDESSDETRISSNRTDVRADCPKLSRFNLRGDHFDRRVVDEDESTITQDQLTRFRKDFDKDSTGTLAQNALQYNPVEKITLRRDLIQTSMDFTFSVELDTMDVTNQKDSGRCWLFATLNLLRMSVASKLNIQTFEFSESYHLFYDKLEKANWFLESILQTSDRDMDDRTLSVLLEDPIDDGGEWTEAVNLIIKYGLVPKSAFPETHSSSHTDGMNDTLYELLISSAYEIRRMVQQQELEKASVGQHHEQQQSLLHTDDIRAFKDQQMDAVFRILCIHLGTPPERFQWQWRDLDNEFHSRGSITPLEFAKEFVSGVPYASYISLIQDPRNEYYQIYTVEFSQTVLGGELDMKYLNVPTEDMKTIAVEMLKDQRPVWFACNVDEEFADKQGLWDAELYDKEGFYGVKNNKMSKADRIRFGTPMGTHAMLITGMDLEQQEQKEEKKDEKPRRWRVENSWGDRGGKDGYYTMNDNWFDDNVFEIIVHPDYLSEKMKEGLKTKPVILPAWDAMTSSRRRTRRGSRRRAVTHRKDD